MYKFPLLALMLLSACGTTVGSADVICDIPTPTFTMDELIALSDETLEGLDLYAAQIDAACNL